MLAQRPHPSDLLYNLLHLMFKSSEALLPTNSLSRVIPGRGHKGLPHRCLPNGLTCFDFLHSFILFRCTLGSSFESRQRSPDIFNIFEPIACRTIQLCCPSSSSLEPDFTFWQRSLAALQGSLPDDGLVYRYRWFSRTYVAGADRKRKKVRPGRSRVAYR